MLARGTTSERFAARFELLATEAGISLDASPETSPRAHWLHFLLLHLRASESDHLRVCNHTARFIERLSEASATYCAYLERCFLERAARIPATETEFLAEEEVSMNDLEGGAQW